MTSAARRWADQLAAWAIPDEILAVAPESPWGFPPELFRADEPTLRDDDRPSRMAARLALPDGGTVLDVGAGGGRASLPLVPPAREIVAVDDGPGMVDLLRAAAAERGVGLRAVTGRWPDAAADVPTADVVVCHHVLYNVPDLVPFAAALTDHARRRVVVEITAQHPWAASAPLWQRFWDLDRPAGPTAALAIEVLREAGIAPEMASFRRPGPLQGASRVALVALHRRRLCLPPEREPEVAAALDEHPELLAAERELVALWWTGTARA